MAERTPRISGNDGERSFDMRSLWRLAIWGVAAAIGLSVVGLATYSNIGSQRLTMAMAPTSGPTAAQLAARSTANENETRRLAALVRTLDTDQEQLLTRIASLEHILEDITGTIRRQVTASAIAGPLPRVPAAMDADAHPPATLDSAPETAIAPQPSIVASNVAARSISDETMAAERAKPEIGIDLGSAINFDGLRLLWKSIHGANAALFEGVHPLVVVRENRRTHAAELRLLVGPFTDDEAATRVCSMLSGSRGFCQPAAFEGQQFALAEPQSRSAAPVTHRPVRPSTKTVLQNPPLKLPAK